MSFKTLKKSFQTDLQDIKDSDYGKTNDLLIRIKKAKSRYKMDLQSSTCAQITISD